MTPLLIAQLVLTLFVFIALLHSAAAMVWVERRLAALLQQRMGPTRVGWQGLLQPFADVIKLMFKEELRPRAADPLLFALAPILSATAAFSAFAVVPFGVGSTGAGISAAFAAVAGVARRGRPRAALATLACARAASALPRAPTGRITAGTAHAQAGSGHWRHPEVLRRIWPRATGPFPTSSGP